jgi:antitoxin component of MazEF toxin-antitoxin module
MIRKVFRSGNSVVVSLDKKMLRVLGLDDLTYVVVEPDKNKKQIIIRKRGENDW